MRKQEGLLPSFMNVGVLYSGENKLIFPIHPQIGLLHSPEIYKGLFTKSLISSLVHARQFGVNKLCESFQVRSRSFEATKMLIIAIETL